MDWNTSFIRFSIGAGWGRKWAISHSNLSVCINGKVRLAHTEDGNGLQAILTFLLAFEFANRKVRMAHRPFPSSASSNSKTNKRCAQNHLFPVTGSPMAASDRQCLSFKTFPESPCAKGAHWFKWNLLKLQMCSYTRFNLNQRRAFCARKVRKMFWSRGIGVLRRRRWSRDYCRAAPGAKEKILKEGGVRIFRIETSISRMLCEGRLFRWGKACLSLIRWRYTLRRFWSRGIRSLMRVSYGRSVLTDRRCRE